MNTFASSISSSCIVRYLNFSPCSKNAGAKLTLYSSPAPLEEVTLGVECVSCSSLFSQLIFAA